MNRISDRKIKDNTKTHLSFNESTMKSSSNIQQTKSFSPRSKEANSFEFKVIPETTPLNQNNILNYNTEIPEKILSGVNRCLSPFPHEIWCIILKYCGTRSLTILRSVSKILLNEIDKLNSLPKAQQHVQKFIQSINTISFDTNLCKIMGVLNNTEIEQIDQAIINFDFDLPPQELFAHKLETVNAMDSKARALKGGFGCFFVGLIIGLIIVVLIGFISRWDTRTLTIVSSIIMTCAALSGGIFLIASYICSYETAITQ